MSDFTSDFWSIYIALITIVSIIACGVLLFSFSSASTGGPGETTGHVWDENLEERNNPLPRWWVWTFVATVLWGVGYVIVYPAWPTLSGGTQGLFGWNSRTEVAQEIGELQTTRAPILAKLNAASLSDIEANPELLAAARMVGRGDHTGRLSPGIQLVQTHKESGPCK